MRIITAGHVQQLVPQSTTEHVIRTKEKPRTVEQVRRSEKNKEKKQRNIDISA
jgi:hypothetical protein|tara:strand:- start:236 stop:394 length:159 start_codon:yes stop_codon:yes gene_type:complete